MVFFQKQQANYIYTPDAPNVWNIYRLIYHKFMIDVGKHSIHGAFEYQHLPNYPLTKNLRKKSFTHSLSLHQSHVSVTNTAPPCGVDPPGFRNAMVAERPI